MTILSDEEIWSIATTRGALVVPFEPQQVSRVDGKGKVISYGLSSFGYDARVGDDFKTMKRYTEPFDPKAPREDAFCALDHDVDGNVWLPAHSHTLCHTVERFRIPDDVLAVCLGKSTYARCGVIVNCTPLEPGWEGQVTLELSNTSPVAVKVYAGEGICQFLFFRGKRPSTTYADRAGKYMNQSGIVLPKV